MLHALRTSFRMDLGGNRLRLRLRDFLLAGALDVPTHPVAPRFVALIALGAVGLRAVDLAVALGDTDDGSQCRLADFIVVAPHWLRLSRNDLLGPDQGVGAGREADGLADELHGVAGLGQVPQRREALDERLGLRAGELPSRLLDPHADVDHEAVAGLIDEILAALPVALAGALVGCLELLHGRGQDLVDLLSEAQEVRQTSHQATDVHKHCHGFSPGRARIPLAAERASNY